MSMSSMSLTSRRFPSKMEDSDTLLSYLAKIVGSSEDALRLLLSILAGNYY